jgi:hypothetical protein
LRAHGAGNGGHDGRQNDSMCCATLAQIAQHKWKRPARISRKIVHDVCKPVESERESSMRIAHDYVKNAASGSGQVAMSPQQFCSIRTTGNFVVSNGISKTAVWRKQDVLTKGTSQMRERSR